MDRPKNMGFLSNSEEYLENVHLVIYYCFLSAVKQCPDSNRTFSSGRAGTRSLHCTIISPAGTRTVGLEQSNLLPSAGLRACGYNHGYALLPKEKPSDKCLSRDIRILKEMSARHLKRENSFEMFSFEKASELPTLSSTFYDLAQSLQAFMPQTLLPQR